MYYPRVFYFAMHHILRLLTRNLVVVLNNVVISGYLRHIPKSKTLWTVLYVLSQSVLFCDAPHLAASDKKFLVIRSHLCYLPCLKNAHLLQVNSAFLACEQLTHLTPSDKKFGRATLDVGISLVPSETITNYSLLITNYFNSF